MRFSWGGGHIAAEIGRFFTSLAVAVVCAPAMQALTQPDLLAGATPWAVPRGERAAVYEVGCRRLVVGDRVLRGI
jgi:hypothetical protein